MIKLKRMRGICAAAMAFLVLLGGMYCAEATPKTGESKEEKMLNFGIIREALPQDEQVTIAQYSAMLVRALGLDEVAASYTQGDWAEGYLVLGESLRFYNVLPEDANLRGAVTAEQAVAMTVAALGYDVTAPAVLEKQYAAGMKIGLCDGLTQSMQSVLNRADAYTIICNALEIDLCVIKSGSYGAGSSYYIDQGNTLMDALMDARDREYFTGVVEATHTVSLTGAEAKEGEVIIGGKRYFVGNTVAEDYVGYHVSFYADFEDDADDGTICWIAPHRKNDVVWIEPKTEKNLDGLRLSYYQNDTDDRETTLDLASSYKAVHNNCLLNTALTESDLEDGYITLIDNNGDGVYEVVLIEKLQSFLVDSINTAAGLIRFKSGTLMGNSGIKLDLDDKDCQYKFYDADDTAMEFADIKPDDAISIAAGKDLKYAVIRRLEAPFSGVITEFDETDSQIVIDNTKYDLVRGTEGVKVGKHATFFTDYFGRVFHIEDGVDSYVYVTKVKQDSGLSDTIRIKVFTRDKEFQTYELAQNASVNGIKTKDAAQKMAQMNEGAVASIRVNEAGEISKIDYAEVHAERGTRTFCENDFGFTDYSDKVLTPFACGKEETAVFFVPASGDEEEYSNTFPLFDDEDYCVTGYDYDKQTGKVRAAVIEMDTQQPLAAGFDSSSKVLAVNSVRQIYRDDAAAYEISGICGGETVTYPAAQIQSVFNVLSTVAPGDVVQFVLNWEGEIGLVRKVMDYSTLSESYYDTSDYRNTQLYAPVKQVNDDVMTNYRKYLVHEILCDVSGSGTITSVVSASEKAVADTQDKGFNNYFVYDAKKKAYQPGSIDSIIPSANGAWEASKVFIQTQSDSGTVKFVAIFN